LWGRQPAAVAMILALTFQLLRASLTSETRRVSIGLEEVLIDEDGVQPVDDAKDGYLLTESSYIRSVKTF
ncbi:hypothetical protein ALC53_06532, partial [Atta colombica]